MCQVFLYKHMFPEYCLCFQVVYFLFFFLIFKFGFCHTLTWINHGFRCVPLPEPPSHLLPHPIPLCHPSTPALSTLSHTSHLDWRFVSHMIIHTFQCYYRVVYGMDLNKFEKAVPFKIKINIYGRTYRKSK